MVAFKVFLLILLIGSLGFISRQADSKPRRILLDTDVNTDDIFALLYILKQNKSEFDLKAITISANAWSDAGHAVNHIYDVLYMMDRDDIPVGVGGDGGILDNDTILPNVGGYLPLIEQGMSTAGDCRYRQAIPIGSGGRLDIDSNFGIRKGFLPQGDRRYNPLQQPTAQQVIIDTISAGPTTVFLIGSQTNFAIFLMTHPHLKKNIEHIYAMAGGVRSKNPTGNVYTDYSSNPYAEYNIFTDPFAAYEVLHSGIPVTLVPLDATNTIPITKQFFMEFEKRQGTYEAQYSFRTLKLIHDHFLSDDQFYSNYFMWDSFASGVALSIMRNAHNYNGKNEFAEMALLNITVVTSNAPYGVYDGSNPFFDGRAFPKFNLNKNGVHSGHVQSGLQDPFCFSGKEEGKCEDGYTKEVTGPEAVEILAAVRAKPNRDVNSLLDREFFKSFLDVLNFHQQSARFNFSTQFPYYKEELYKPDFTNRTIGKPVIFDMDMSAGDFLALLCLLKVPVEVMDLKGILVSGNGWANTATIDIIYDVLHMMGRDDIPVGVGNVTPLGTSSLGCKYAKAIPHGSGGFIDSDTLFGLARTLPQSPRRYTAENSVKYGAPRDTDHPELRQPLALEVWQSISTTLNPSDKITILTNGPLTNLANILLSVKNASSVIKDVYIVGGHVIDGQIEEGNVFTVPSNKYSEFNMFLDPVAAKTVLESDLDVILIPLGAQRQVTSFSMVLKSLELAHKTPESEFALRLLSLLHKLQQQNQLYRHMDTFLGEILGAVFMANESNLNPVMKDKPLSVLAGETSSDGQIVINKRNEKFAHILDSFDSKAYYNQFADLLGAKAQSAVISSFDAQKRKWINNRRRHTA